MKRGFIYKALNKLIQGSAADQTKKAMIEVHKVGIIPHIQVHDELNFSITGELMSDEIKQIMENCVQLEVPSKVDAKDLSALSGRKQESEESQNVLSQGSADVAPIRQLDY